MSKITNDGLTRSGQPRMLYSGTHMVTVCVKGLTQLVLVDVFQMLLSADLSAGVDVGSSTGMYNQDITVMTSLLPQSTTGMAEYFTCCAQHRRLPATSHGDDDQQQFR